MNSDPESLDPDVPMMTCYDDVMRTIIDLPPAQLDALDAWCARDGISRAEAIRRAVAAAVGSQAAVARDSAYGMWRDRRIDGLAWQESMRAEWDAAATRTRHTRKRPGARGRRP